MKSVQPNRGNRSSQSMGILLRISGRYSNTIGEHKTTKNREAAVHRLTSTRRGDMDTLRELIQNMPPKVQTFKRFISSAGVKNMNQVATELGSGRNCLLKLLRIKGVFFRTDSTNFLYQRYVDADYFLVRTAITKRNNRNYSPVFVTARGEHCIAQRLHNDQLSRIRKVTRAAAGDDHGGC